MSALFAENPAHPDKSASQKLIWKAETDRDKVNTHLGLKRHKLRGILGTDHAMSRTEAWGRRRRAKEDAGWTIVSTTPHTEGQFMIGNFFSGSMVPLLNGQRIS